MPKPQNQFVIRSLGVGAITPPPTAPSPRQKKNFLIKEKWLR